jgi:hypothetical protein
VTLPVVVLDGLGSLIKVPLHSFSVVSPSLEGNIVGTNAFNHSTEWKLRLDVEWSVHMESKVFVKTFGHFFFGFI